MSSFTLRYYLVVLAGILICLGPCALVYNTWAIFVVPVSETLGVSSSSFTFFITLIYLIGAIASPVAGNLMERFDLRAVLSVSVIFVAFGMGCCSLWTEVWQFYISGVIEGLGIVSLMFLAVPTLINRWFVKRTGFFIGLCLAMSGVGGALWSVVGGVLLTYADWHVAYAAFASIVLLLGLPAATVCIRSYPQELKLNPYGTDSKESSESHDEILLEDTFSHPSLKEEKGKQWGISCHVVFRSPIFYTLMLAMGIFNALTVVGNLFASYIYHVAGLSDSQITPEMAIVLASGVSACIMIVSALSKVGLGALSDRNLVFALVLPCCCGVASILCMWFGITISTLFVYAGGLLFGVLYAAVDALGATVTRQLVGPRNYTVIYSRVAIAVNLSGALAATAFAAVADLSWDAEWIMAIGLIVLAFLLGLYTIIQGRRKFVFTYE